MSVLNEVTVHVEELFRPTQVVGIYTDIIFDSGHPTLRGQPLSTQEVGTDGLVHFTGLTEGTTYYIGAIVEEEWRYVATATAARNPKIMAQEALDLGIVNEEGLEATDAALAAKTLKSLADVDGGAPHARRFVKRNTANSGYYEAEDPVANVLEYGADPTGVADSTAAFAAAVAALPASGGRVLVPAGWYIVRKLEVTKPNVHIEGSGRAGDGVTGSFEARTTSGTQLVNDEEEGWIIAFGKKVGEGSVEWRGAKVSNLSFADSSGTHQKLKAAVILRMMNNGVFTDCAWHNLRAGTAVMEETDGVGNPQYWHFYTPEIFYCKNGVLGGGDDMRMFGGKIQGVPIAAGGAIAGGVGLELNGNGRCYGTALQNNDTDLVLRRQNNAFYGRIETNAALVAPHPTSAIRIKEGATNSIVQTTVTNGATYSGKIVVVEAGCTGIRFLALGGFTVEASHIENLSPTGTTWMGGDGWQENGGNKQTIAINPNTRTLFLVGGEKTIERLAPTFKGHIITVVSGKEYAFKDSAAEGNLKLGSEFVSSADDTLTLVCDGTSWFEIARSAN